MVVRCFLGDLHVVYVRLAHARRSDLDEAGTLYQVVIIKTPLAMPYTTTFFQLDCKYWNAAKQAKLDKAMGKM